MCFSTMMNHCIFFIPKGDSKLDCPSSPLAHFYPFEAIIHTVISPHWQVLYHFQAFRFYLVFHGRMIESRIRYEVGITISSREEVLSDPLGTVLIFMVINNTLELDFHDWNTKMKFAWLQECPSTFQ